MKQQKKQLLPLAIVFTCQVQFMMTADYNYTCCTVADFWEKNFGQQERHVGCKFQFMLSGIQKDSSQKGKGIQKITIQTKKRKCIYSCNRSVQCLVWYVLPSFYGMYLRKCKLTSNYHSFSIYSALNPQIRLKWLLWVYFVTSVQQINETL